MLHRSGDRTTPHTTARFARDRRTPARRDHDMIRRQLPIFVRTLYVNCVLVHKAALRVEVLNSLIDQRPVVLEVQRADVIRYVIHHPVPIGLATQV